MSWVLGIDASNIRGGGGVTHLSELLRAAEPREFGCERVVVWAGTKTLDALDERPWLRGRTEPLLNRGLMHRAYWQRFLLRRRLREERCSLLFVPGGSDASGYAPLVTMAQNLIPFDPETMALYGVSPTRLKFELLRRTQGRTFRRAAGVIHLTEFARRQIIQSTKSPSERTTVVPHGISERFFIPPRPPRAFDAFTPSAPCRLLYVSIAERYKHHVEVVKAAGELRAAGAPIILDLVDPPGPASENIERVVRETDPTGSFIHRHGTVPYERLHEMYRTADIALFASSCETFGQILTESMASGLPIACSNRSALPELLDEAGIYFDPERPHSIAAAVDRLMRSPDLRATLANAAFARAAFLSWPRCARETFAYFAEVARSHASARPRTVNQSAHV